MIFSKTLGRACLLQIQSLLLLLSSSLVNHSISGQCAMVFPGLSIWDGRWGAKNLLTEAGNCANHSSAHFRNCSFTASIAICCISKLLLIHFYFSPPQIVVIWPPFPFWNLMEFSRAILRLKFALMFTKDSEMNRGSSACFQLNGVELREITHKAGYKSPCLTI